MEDDGTVGLDFVCVVELHCALTHVHRVRREPTAHEPDRGVVGCVVRGTGVGRRGDGDVEVVAAVGELGRHVLWRGTGGGGEVRRVEDFGFVRCGEVCCQIDVDIRVRASDEDGGVGHEHSGRVV